MPATGKSTFGRWLARKKGYVHIDLESGGLERVGLTAAWQQSIAQLRPTNVQPFVTALHNISQPVVLDWGFPLPYFSLVRALHAAGVSAWWFDGDRRAARAAFFRRATVSVAALDRQMRNIEEHDVSLANFYGTRVIQAVDAAGSFTSADSIFASILSELNC